MAITLIIKNRSVKDYFVRYTQFKDIRYQYEKGRIIIFDNIDFFDKYKAFLEKEVRSIVSKEMRIKKAKGADLLNSLYGSDHILANFTNKQKELQNIIRQAYIYVKEFIVPTLFPGYRIAGDNWTWRLTKTGNEVMHLDSYAGQNNNLHNVRIFINIDNEPRIWNVSYDLDELYKRFNYLFKDVSKNAHPNEANDILNKRISWKDLPYHQIFFAPYTMWCCNSQLISHQVVKGSKLAAYTFKIDPSTMYDENYNFINQAKRLISAPTLEQNEA